MYIIFSNVLFLNVTLFEQVTRQLFEPLVMQLIHWFTNNKKFESQDTVAVLEAIMVTTGWVYASFNSWVALTNGLLDTVSTILAVCIFFPCEVNHAWKDNDFNHFWSSRFVCQLCFFILGWCGWLNWQHAQRLFWPLHWRVCEMVDKTDHT